MACNTACPFVKNCGRWKVYATTKATGTQYYRIYDKLCDLYCNRSVVCDIESTGTSDSSAAVLLTTCGGILPMYAASTLETVKVSQLPAGTSIQLVAKSSNGIPKAIVLGL